MSTTRPWLTLREASDACGVSRTTLRRRRDAGELPGAVLDSRRGWLIPVDALLAAGLHLNAPPPNAKDGDGPAVPPAALPGDVDGGGGEAVALRAEVERLRHQHALEMAEARHARELAEQQARHLAEQLQDRSEHIASLQRALLALTPAPERAAIPAPAAPTGEPTPAVPEQPAAGDGDQEPAQQRRRWWGGRRA